MTKAEFESANRRRCELIDKETTRGFTAEERGRSFDDHPGWFEECERRWHANLTDAERTELAGLEEVVGAYIHGDLCPDKTLLAWHDNLLLEIHGRFIRTCGVRGGAV